MLQFISCSQFKHQNSGKDINLLINSNPYTTTQKTANLDLEKDRSHECKNSTEHLEKELPCKTSTLTKVKRTYIWEKHIIQFFWWPVYHKISRIFVVYVAVSCSNSHPKQLDTSTVLQTRLKRASAHPKLLCLTLVFCQDLVKFIANAQPRSLR